MPLITLKSATCVLGVDSLIQLLAVCLKCREVYPSLESGYLKETCTICNAQLFLPDHTQQGNQCTLKTLVIKYLYLPLSDQIGSILKIPGVERVLDDWHAKPRIPGSMVISSMVTCVASNSGHQMAPYSSLIVLMRDMAWMMNFELESILGSTGTSCFLRLY